MNRKAVVVMAALLALAAFIVHVLIIALVAAVVLTVAALAGRPQPGRGEAIPLHSHPHHHCTDRA